MKPKQNFSPLYAASDVRASGAAPCLFTRFNFLRAAKNLCFYLFYRRAEINAGAQQIV
jgi:hypothetical protein